MAPPLLAIDTTGPRLQLALDLGGEQLVLVEDMAQGQAERLFPALAELYARAGIAPKQLGRIAVTTGPGSFTGLRIGLSAARGLGLALDIPVIGVGTLVAMSLSASGPSAVLVDARRSEAYLQLFAGPGQPEGPAEILPLAEAEALAARAPERLTLPFADIGRLATFAAGLDPARFPPEAAYIRSADAKPQEKFRVARVSS